MSKVHPLKTWPEFFEVVGRSKTFEVRKNDRDFKVGDILWLQEWNKETEEYTGKDKKFTVTYILEGFGIEKGYCVMGLGPVVAMRGSNQIDELFEDLFKVNSADRKRYTKKYMESDEAEEIFK